MNLPLEHALKASAGLTALPKLAEEARQANDTDAAKAALRRLSVATLDAMDAIQRGEFEARLYHKESA